MMHGQQNVKNLHICLLYYLICITQYLNSKSDMHCEIKKKKTMTNKRTANFSQEVEVVFNYNRTADEWVC